MLIVCPACASAYEIETDRVGPEGRAVRCAACRETWFVSPETVASALGAHADREPAEHAILDPLEQASNAGDAGGGATGAVIDHPTPLPRWVEARAKGRLSPMWTTRPPARMRLPKPSPALAVGLLLFVALPLALLGRGTVVRAMPRTAGLFAAAGLPVNLRGVEIRDVVAFRNLAEAGKPATLVVEGDLVGVARERVTTAPLEIEIRDAAERPLFRWTAPAPRAALEPAETARFRASLLSPPLQGSRVDIRFAEAKGNAGKPSNAGQTATDPAAGHADGAAVAEAVHPGR